jgi:hypothetical protein
MVAAKVDGQRDEPELAGCGAKPNFEVTKTNGWTGMAFVSVCIFGMRREKAMDDGNEFFVYIGPLCEEIEMRWNECVCSLCLLAGGCVCVCVVSLSAAAAWYFVLFSFYVMSFCHRQSHLLII